MPGLNESEAWRTNWPKATFIDYMLLVLSGICGIAIGWTAINAQQYVTATTMLVITNLNKISWSPSESSSWAILTPPSPCSAFQWRSAVASGMPSRAERCQPTGGQGARGGLAAATTGEAPGASKAKQADVAHRRDVCMLSCSWNRLS